MEIREQVSLKDYAWWKIGGPADFFCLPTTIDEVREAVDFAHGRGLPVTVLGGGTNVLISDAGVEGLVICMKKLVGVEEEERDGRLVITALAGTPKSELTKRFLKRRLPPALFLCGLPGDVGGGVVMNAGVGEMIVPREFVEITDWVEVLERSAGGRSDATGLPRSRALEGSGSGIRNLVKRYKRDELRWTYRHTSGYDGIVVRAGISWPLIADDQIPLRVKEATKNRLARQPLDLPSCGSTFKNPEGGKAGALIEGAGLKGYRVGGAEVSLKHANFIVNTGGATATDVRAIISHVQSEVKKRSGFSLETEVRLLGRW